MTEPTQKEKIDKLINATQLVFAELLDSELYLPMKQELAQHDITHALGFKKEVFKSKVECLFGNLKKDLEDDTTEIKSQRPYIVALEHEDNIQENVIIDAESPENALDILYDNDPGVVRDCKNIVIGLVGKVWYNEFKRKTSANDKLIILSLEDKIESLRGE